MLILRDNRFNDLNLSAVGQLSSCSKFPPGFCAAVARLRWVGKVRYLFLERPCADAKHSSAHRKRQSLFVNEAWSIKFPKS